MIFKVLSLKEIQDLNDELRSRLPGTAKVRHLFILILIIVSTMVYGNVIMHLQTVKIEN